MWCSREGPRVFWLASGETSAEARDPFISVWIRSHIGTSRRILRLSVGKDITEQGDHSCFQSWSCRMATHSVWSLSVLPRLLPSSIRSNVKTNRQEPTIAIADLHSFANQASVANHDQETLLREHHFDCMFACTGSFQLLSVRHATPITRSTRSLTEAGRRDASLISSHV